MSRRNAGGREALPGDVNWMRISLLDELGGRPKPCPQRNPTAPAHTRADEQSLIKEHTLARRLVSFRDEVPGVAREFLVAELAVDWLAERRCL